MEGTNDTLIFSAKLVSDYATDGIRVFGLTYYISDQTMAIVEGQTRGCATHGRFLAKSRVVNPQTKRPYDPQSLYVGARITAAGRVFELVDAPDFTLRVMESNPSKFAYASITKSLTSLVNACPAHGKDLESIFEDVDPTNSGEIEEELAKKTLFALAPQLQKHEALTIVRRFTRNGIFDSLKMMAYAKY